MFLEPGRPRPAIPRRGRRVSSQSPRLNAKAAKKFGQDKQDLQQEEWLLASPPALNVPVDPLDVFLRGEHERALPRHPGQ